jgi:FKBP-type peptidyl-prolyl cis-trans isomerase
MRVSVRAAALMAASLSGVCLLADSKPSEFKTDKEKSSYAVGQQIGKSIRDQGLELESDVLTKSIVDALAGKESLFTPEEMQTTLTKLQETMQKAMVEKANKNKEIGDKFLSENKKKSGIKTTASGLQYKVVMEGKGDSPKEDAQVKVHYKGTLLDGTEFDSSYKRNEPAVFPVTGVIPGWTEALKMMKPGAKWELAIPSDLAYGPRGRPGIPPNSVLQFTVELVEIIKEEKKPIAINKDNKPVIINKDKSVKTH